MIKCTKIERKQRKYKQTTYKAYTDSTNDTFCDVVCFMEEIQKRLKGDYENNF